MKKIIFLLPIFFLTFHFSSAQKHTPSIDKTKKLIQRGWVSYSDFGAAGDGKTDDMPVIAAAHDFANIHDLEVRADSQMTYYISGKALSAEIMTHTDFSDATFLIDDRSVENRRSSVFKIVSKEKPYPLKGINKLDKNQQRINSFKSLSPVLVKVTNRNIRRYIRKGLNQNKGSFQTDIFLVDEQGNIDRDAPIIWDFEEITQGQIIPVDQTELKLKGGIFITLANQDSSRYAYYDRNILIKRSNVTVDGLQHYVKNEGEHGAPYNGFLRIQEAAFVTVKNSLFTGRKTYTTTGSAGKPVAMGSYDIIVNKALHVSFINCSQSNDIHDRTYWGIMGSNFSKNILFDHCEFSRFDAHQGVANATIRNSKLGHMGINAIGSGTFLIENSKIMGSHLVHLRTDYGSSWDGEIIIRNSIFRPNNKNASHAFLIHGYNDGSHDFGYTSRMPSRVVVENLEIDDSNFSDKYKGPFLFADFNPLKKKDSYIEKYPYLLTEKVILKNIRTSSGKPLKISNHPELFKKTKVSQN